MKKLGALLVSAVLVFTTLTQANAAAWDFPTANSVPDGTTLLAVNEPSHFDSWNSWNSYKRGPFSGWGPESHVCPTGIDDKNCNPSDYDVKASSILPVCETASSENCVVGITLSSASQSATAAKFIKLVEGTYYQGDPKQNLVGGSGVSLWEAEGFTHLGGTANYSVIVKLNQEYRANEQRFVPTSITTAVMPYSLRTGGTPPVSGENIVDGVSRVFTNHDSTCAWSGAGYCGQVEDFPEGIRVELELRLPKELTGWFRGRLKAPDASITPFSGTNNSFKISGEPVTVPRIAAYVTKDNISAETQTTLANMGGKNPSRPLFTGQAIRDSFSNQGEFIFKLIDGVRVATKDTAAGVSTLWNFSTMENRGNNQCLNDTTRVLGIVTTNASAYEGNPPKFESGQLTYKVAGVHFGPDGKTENLGTYDLVMRSDVARCLYGFSNAPVSATIAVQNEAGSVNVATKVVNEKGGWLKLAAYGFTFSNPKISIKLTQTKKKITITCVKGKLTKKISGTAPKCPSGYKKKK